jgi:hypothetical protein
MNQLEAEQLFHRVARFPAPRRNPITREPASVQWRPRYVATPPLLEQAVVRSATGWGRRGAGGGKGLRKTFE